MFQCTISIKMFNAWHQLTLHPSTQQCSSVPFLMGCLIYYIDLHQPHMVFNRYFWQCTKGTSYYLATKTVKIIIRAHVLPYRYHTTHLTSSPSNRYETKSYFNLKIPLLDPNALCSTISHQKKWRKALTFGLGGKNDGLTIFSLFYLRWCSITKEKNEIF